MAKNEKKKRTYGSGTLYYDEKNRRYVGQVKVTAIDGKVKKRSVSGRTQKEARDKLKKLQAEVITGDIYAPSNITVATIAERINDNKFALNLIGERTKTYAGLRNIKLSVNTQNLLKSYVKKHFTENEYHICCLLTKAAV